MSLKNGFAKVMHLPLWNTRQLLKTTAINLSPLAQEEIHNILFCLKKTPEAPHVYQWMNG